MAEEHLIGMKIDDCRLTNFIKEWIHFKYFLSDRINRMNWIFSRFPDETVKIASAWRRKFGNHMRENGNAMICRLIVKRSSALTLAINFSAKRIAYTRFRPETGYIKYSIYPVNPVYLKD
jgi:hypothetical protein